jgi:hypothetical protein
MEERLLLHQKVHFLRGVLIIDISLDIDDEQRYLISNEMLQCLSD